MYEGIRGAMAADDALKRQGMEIRFRVRETSEWKLHAAELETEMLRRGMMFEVIDWSEDQARLPFDEWGCGLRPALLFLKPLNPSAAVLPDRLVADDFGDYGRSLPWWIISALHEAILGTWRNRPEILAG
jgi:hypothetical protein